MLKPQLKNNLEQGCTSFFQGPKFIYPFDLNFENLMQHSPGGQHTHDMLVFIVNLIVGSELAPQVRVPSSLPVLYVIIILGLVAESNQDFEL